MKRNERIHLLLEKECQPLYLDVQDESHQHHVPENAQTHIKLTLVTSQFEQQSKIARHRWVNKLLADEFNSGLHALSLHLYTPKEWETIAASPRSPACRDGFQHG